MIRWAGLCLVVVLCGCSHFIDTEWMPEPDAAPGSPRNAKHVVRIYGEPQQAHELVGVVLASWTGPTVSEATVLSAVRREAAKQGGDAFQVTDRRATTYGGRTVTVGTVTYVQPTVAYQLHAAVIRWRCREDARRAIDP